MIPRPLLDRILTDYALPTAGLHGLSHWARVLEIGRRLSAQPGVRGDVVELFAVLHDACRVGESVDRGHGPRAAELARTLRGSLFDLDDGGFALLTEAIHGHTDGRTSPDATVGACWDSDRLDLGRAGIQPADLLLSTPLARQPQIQQWADERSRRLIVPPLVADEWGISDIRRPRQAAD